MLCICFLWEIGAYPSSVETRRASAVPSSFTYLASKFTCTARPTPLKKEVLYKVLLPPPLLPMLPHSLPPGSPRPAPPRATNSSARWGKRSHGASGRASERGWHSESPARGCARRPGEGTQIHREPFRGQQSGRRASGRTVHSLLLSSHRADNFPSFSLIYDDNQVSQERGRRRRKGRRGFLQLNSLLLTSLSVRPSGVRPSVQARLRISLFYREGDRRMCSIL